MKSLLRIAAILAVVLAACGEDNKVGEGVDLGIKNQVEQERLGQRTTTTAPPETTAPPQQQKAGIGQATTTTAAPVTTAAAPPTTQQQVAIEISINGDSSGTTQFEPSQARVFSGSLVKWTNRDSVARSVEADDGTFNSGMLEPGQSFTYRADKVGRFNYTDGTRPYAVGALEVIGR